MSRRNPLSSGSSENDKRVHDVADRTWHLNFHSRQLPIEQCNDARCKAYTKRHEAKK